MIFFRFLFFQSHRPTDPISGNAFDAKRKKRGWPYSKVKKCNVKTKLNGASVSQRKRRLLKKLKATLSFDRILAFVPRLTSYLKGQKGKRKR